MLRPFFCAHLEFLQSAISVAKTIDDREYPYEELQVRLVSLRCSHDMLKMCKLETPLADGR